MVRGLPQPRATQFRRLQRLAAPACQDLWAGSSAGGFRSGSGSGLDPGSGPGWAGDVGSGEPGGGSGSGDGPGGTGAVGSGEPGGGTGGGRKGSGSRGDGIVMAFPSARRTAGDGFRIRRCSAEEQGSVSCSREGNRQSGSTLRSWVFLKAFLNFPAACFRSDFAWSALPSAFGLSSPVASPAASLPLPLSFSASVHALSLSPLWFLSMLQTQLVGGSPKPCRR